MYLHPVDKFIRINNDSTSIAFVCIANGSRSYFWQRDIGDIPSSAVGSSTDNLVLQNILPLTSGRYRCVAVNGHGTTNSKYAILNVEGIYNCYQYIIIKMCIFHSYSSSGKC